MKANELRIGNYVNINGNNIPLTPALFCLIIDNQIAPPKPIPLTEDILLKCGYWKLEHKTINFVNTGHSIWRLDGRFYCEKNGVKINYLHQLQNLYFALTNQELTITL